MSKQRWHTVRFVDEPGPPHSSSQWQREAWKKLRGKEVRITNMVSRTEVEFMPGDEELCDCEQFFELLDLKFDNPEQIPVACRRMLEMD
jgi:hypothetical protein